MAAKRTAASMVVVLLIAAALAAAQESRVRPARIKVTAEQANLREKPDIGSSILQQIPEGTILEADRKEGEWFLARHTLEDGGVIGGYIHESLVEIVEAGGPVPETVTEGRQAPPAERGSRPERIGRIRLSDLSTGPFPLEFSISAGAGTIDPGDLNNGTRGYADWTGAELGVQAPGDAAVLHAASFLGFELSYRISPRLTVGLGADYLRSANRGELVYRDDLNTTTLVTKPSARAVPFKVIARFYPGQGLYFRGALGIYSASAGYLYRLEGEDGWEQQKGKATGAGMGAEGAFGGEWELAPKTIFFAEAGFRLARFGRLTGKNVITDSDGEAVTEPGTLYFFRSVAADTNTYPLLLVMESAPADAVDARRAVLNLSGMAIRAGVRYRF